MGVEVLFNDGKCIILKDEREIIIGYLVDSKFYVVNIYEEVYIVSVVLLLLVLWYCRFGYLNYIYIDWLIKDKFVEGMNCLSGEVSRECEVCV